ncbi:phage tail protein [Nocardioides sp. GXZ039]|uniref:phage tail protein n=1 Tax=Nocardioides sp. GXZ039 TaxID=3136018 RepID=UPI0030F470F0
MSNEHVGEIRMVGFGRTPSGWLACDGSLKSIAEYDVLYTLLGTTYGGDGQSTFAVPDLRGRVPIHFGRGPGLSDYPPGQQWGVEQVTVTPSQLPVHTHSVPASAGLATSTSPVGAVPATLPTGSGYAATGSVSMAADAVSSAGGSQPHDNLSPRLAVHFIIAAFGIFPSQE